MPVSILVTGPARSGKSEFAEHLIRQHHHDVVYIATAIQNRDDYEWQARIARHRDRRPSTWKTLEAPRDLVGSIRACNNQIVPPYLLIDSFGTWVANWLDDDIAAWKNECDDLIAEITTYRGLIICVAEETGWGVVPAYTAGRLFRDRLGDITRQTAAIVDQAYLVVAGYAIDLKQVGSTIQP